MIEYVYFSTFVLFAVQILCLIKIDILNATMFCMAVASFVFKLSLIYFMEWHTFMLVYITISLTYGMFLLAPRKHIKL